MSYKKTSTYVAKAADANGNVIYTEEENQTWHMLMSRQLETVQGRACDEFIQGIQLLDLPHDRIPQCHEVSRLLQEMTGWVLEPVPALIPFEQFFQLIANRKFPAATFIRRRDELDYLEEPDIFHEVFGHCPLLTQPSYANFTHLYGKLGLTASPRDRAMLAKLYWFTIEFGLMQTKQGLRAYGGGILSSHSETQYCLESAVPLRKPFNVLDVLRTPYQIDVIQPIYFIIDDFDVLFQLTQMDLMALIDEANHLGMYPAITG